MRAERREQQPAAPSTAAAESAAGSAAADAPAAPSGEQSRSGAKSGKDKEKEREPSAEMLEAHASRKWGGVLLYLVGSDKAQLATSAPIGYGGGGAGPVGGSGNAGGAGSDRVFISQRECVGASRGRMALVLAVRARAGQSRIWAERGGAGRSGLRTIKKGFTP